MDNLLSPALDLQPSDISAWRQGSDPDSSGIDDVLIMPVGRPQAGTTAVRLGRACA